MEPRTLVSRAVECGGLPVILSLLFAEVSWSGEEDRSRGGEATCGSEQGRGWSCHHNLQQSESSEELFASGWVRKSRSSQTFPS